ncbi:FAD/NAD(P)-binding domain-containing protein [Auriculariales sp. MPI-PUGE-AT-0066]|nr:FAD/NAD(P)-binding domain-containing protein [Auriculariales sp. MPI-PUGE-AT-0066]
MQQPLEAKPKRIAVVGLGAGGIATLRAFSGLPEDVRPRIIITAFDDRESVGGLWVPQDDVPEPPALPKTPLYPGVRTAGPHPGMTVPNVPFEPETPLLAPRDAVLRYWQRLHNDSLLSSTRVLLQHSVLSANWKGSSSMGEWHLTYIDLTTNVTATKVFDHLIAAPGVNHIPYSPPFAGQEEWLHQDSRRVLIHSMWYRNDSIFHNRTVLVIGGGASGLDVARHSGRSAKKVYWSRRETSLSLRFFNAPTGVESVPAFSHFASDAVHLSNGSALPQVDFVILATGYQVRFPFLTAGGVLDEVDSDSPQPDDHLTTNARYVHPLYEHTLSLDQRYPLSALFFIGIARNDPTGIACYAQALFAAHTLTQPSLLQTRLQLLSALKAREDRVRADSGVEPGRNGHKIDSGYGARAGYDADGPYQDLLVHSLRELDPSLAGQSGIPRSGFNYTERWRRSASMNSLQVMYGWHARLVNEGEGLDGWEGDFVRGVRSEADYLDAVSRFVEWWEEHKDSVTASSI